MFKKLFGSGASSSSKPSVPSSSGAAANQTINTIQQLTDSEESLEKRKAVLEKRIEVQLEKAKEATRQKKKSEALMCLKRKKLLESEMANLDNMIMRVIEQRSMLEGQRTAVEVVSTMHSAAMTAKKNMQEMKIDDVDKVLDEINETTDQMKQIQDAFANPTGFAADLDDDELLGELEEMEATELDKELLEPAPVPTTKVPGHERLPSVPTKQKQQPAKTKEEEELEALQVWGFRREVCVCCGQGGCVCVSCVCVFVC